MFCVLFMNIRKPSYEAAEPSLHRPLALRNRFLGNVIFKRAFSEGGQNEAAIIIAL